MKKRFVAMALVLTAGVVAPQWQGPGKRPDGTWLLPNGWSLSPAGRQLPLGGLPLNLMPLPDQRHVLVMSNGYTQHFIGVIDVETETLKEKIPIPQGWLGLTLSPDANTVYASGAGDNRVLVYRFSAGTLRADGEIKLESNTFVAGMCMDPRGERLYVTGNLSNALHFVDTSRRSLLHSVRVGYRPYTCTVSADGRTGYVSNWGDNSIAVIDLASGTPGKTIAVREKPNALLLSPDGARLFVANGNRNIVSVVDTKRGTVVEEIDIALVPNSPPGSTPNALSLSPDGRTLYVASADNNALAVVDVSEPRRSRPRGFIPTGWYPTAVAVTAGGKKIVVANGKGEGSRENASTWTSERGPGYVGNLMPGTISIVATPSAEQLGIYSRQAHSNSPYASKAAAPAQPPFPLSDKCPIRNVIYIVKENRTYDQILGDMKQGNGDPKYCLFPERVTPNHHALASEFVLLDNVYHDAEVSADGHHWVTAAYATDYVEKFWPGDYGGFFKGKRPSDLHDDPVAFSSAGFIWDLCARAGLPYRVYGEFGRRSGVPDGQVRPATPSLVGHLHPTYYGASGTGPGGQPSILAQSDLERFELFRKDLERFEKTGEMPRFILMSLPGDHTVGTMAGAPTPRAFLAANDLALGKIVEAVSRSRFWKQTAIFVIEDDTQQGADHIDVHRTPAFVVSPYTRRKFVDSSMYSSSSMLKTMEMILGLPPLTQYDAAAVAMWRSFQAQPDVTPYRAKEARIPLDEKNSPRAYKAKRSAELLVNGVDTAPDAELSEIIWKAVKGRNSIVPAPRVATFVAPRSEEQREEQK